MTAVELTSAQICVIAGALALAYADERSYRDRSAGNAMKYTESRQVFVGSARMAERHMAEIMETAEGLPDFGQRTFASELGELDDSAAVA